MRRIKRFFVVLSVFLLTVTLSACVIDETNLENMLNQINSVSVSYVEPITSDAETSYENSSSQILESQELVFFSDVTHNDFFTLTEDIYSKKGVGKVPNDGWLSGIYLTTYLYSKNLEKPQFGSYGIIFKTKSPATVYLYATGGNNTSATGDLSLINNYSKIVETVHPSKTIACYSMTVPYGGTYQISASSRVSPIYIYAVKVDIHPY